jgi:hypothetical protein
MSVVVQMCYITSIPNPPCIPLLQRGTGGASRQGAQPCPVPSLPGRPATRIRAPKEMDFVYRNRNILCLSASIRPLFSVRE